MFAAPAVAGAHALTLPALSMTANCTTYVPARRNETEVPVRAVPNEPPLVE